MNRYITKTGSVCAAAIALCSSLAHAEYTISDIGMPGYVSFQVNASKNGYAAWYGYNLITNVNDSFYFDGTTTHLLPRVTDSSHSHQVNEQGDVVWLGTDLSTYEHKIMLWRNGVVSILGSGNHTGNARLANNGNVSWTSVDSAGVSAIYVYDGTQTKKVIDIYTTYIRTNDFGQLVWSVYDGNDYEVFSWNGVSVTQLTNNTVNDHGVAINNSGDVVFHRGEWGFNKEIYYWDGVNTTLVTDTAAYSTNSELNDLGQIVWHQPTAPSNPNTYNGPKDIFLWDGTNTTLVVSNINFNDELEFNNAGQILWGESDPNNSNRHSLQVFHGGVTQTITAPMLAIFDVKLTESGKATWWFIDAEPNRGIAVWDGTATTILNDGSQFDNEAPVITEDGDVFWQKYDYNANSLSILHARANLNAAPVADAGADQSDVLGQNATLDATASSDADGDALTYSWTLVDPNGLDATTQLSDPASATPTFYIDMVGEYIATLTVNDGQVDSATDSVLVSTLNVTPIANAGLDQAPHVGSVVTLDASASYDPDWDVIPATPLTYSWTLARPDGSDGTLDLSSPFAVNPNFTVSMLGTYVATLVVTDATDASTPDQVIISTENVAPVANPGNSFSTYVGNSIMLDASGSSDADGDALTYAWSLVSAPVGSSASLMASTTVSPTIVPDQVGLYVIGLVVDDGYTMSGSANLTMTVVTPEDAASVSAGNLINAINDPAVIDPSALVNPNSGNALTNKLNAIISGLATGGSVASAIDKLENDLLPKTDGCALRGAPDSGGKNTKDWIVDCDSQALVYPVIVEIINTLK